MRKFKRTFWGFSTPKIACLFFLNCLKSNKGLSRLNKEIINNIILLLSYWDDEEN